MSEMSRPIAVDRIGAGGLDREVEATPEELAGIAVRLQVPAVLSMRCRFRLRQAERSVVEASGVLSAVVTRICVVSLDEFDQAVVEAFDVRFVPAGAETDSDDPDAPDEIPYPAGAIDLGEAAIEQLALALDAYPHKPGLDEPAELESAPGAFAALAGLRRPQ